MPHGTARAIDTCAERDLVARNRRPVERAAARPYAQGAGQRLVILAQLGAETLAASTLGDAALPGALYVGRDHPEVDRAERRPERTVWHVHLDRGIGFPVAQPEVVRHDARARPQAGELRLQFPQQPGQQVQRDDGRRRQVCLEQVAPLEGHPGRQAELPCLVVARPHQVRFDLDAQSARPATARRFDNHATISRSEVDHEIGIADPRQFEHRPDHRPRRGNIGRAGDRRSLDRLRQGTTDRDWRRCQPEHAGASSCRGDRGGRLSARAGARCHPSHSVCLHSRHVRRPLARATMHPASDRCRATVPSV